MSNRIFNFIFMLLITGLLSACVSSTREKFEFVLELSDLDNQSIVPILEGNLRFHDHPAEEIISLPENLVGIRFASIHSSKSSDSLTTIISGKSQEGEIFYVVGPVSRLITIYTTIQRP